MRPQAAAAALDDAPGTHLYAFGLHLFQLGEYYRATTELQRFTLLFPGHRRSRVARLLIGLALQEDGLYDDALSQFQKLRQVDASTDVGRAVNRVFTGFAIREYGERSFKVRRVDSVPDKTQPAGA